MTYCIDIYNPTPATHPRTKTICYDSLASCFAEIETYVYMQQLGEEKKTDAHITSADSRIVRMRWDKVIFTIEALPFELNETEKLDCQKFEDVGECRKYQAPKPRVPDFAVTARDGNIQTVIFNPMVGAFTSDPLEVFTTEFLKGIGYYNAKDGA